MIIFIIVQQISEWEACLAIFGVELPGATTLGKE